jgi:protein-S-isoprenylcysteine O-methyltransferase Ste14
MSVLIRAITYATLFIGLVLVVLPAQVLSRAGAAVAIGCILSFALVGRGTAAPFDPPRRLVVRGPYRHVRNPMYLGAGLALAGAALFYETGVLWAYAGGFLLLTHLFVVLYEEPTLRETFGEDYKAYCRRVHRWWPIP